MSASFWQCTICGLLNSLCNNECNSCLSEKSFNPFTVTRVNQQKYYNINSWTSMVEMIKRENHKHWKCAKPYIDLLFHKIYSIECNEKNNNNNNNDINYHDENKCIHLVNHLKQLINENEEYYNQFKHHLIMPNIRKINILLDLLSINSKKLKHIRYICNDRNINGCNKLKCNICRRKMIKIYDNFIQNKCVNNNQYRSNIKINTTINLMMKNNKILDIESSSGHHSYYNINVKTGKMFIVTIINYYLLNFIIYDINKHEIEFEKNSCNIYDHDDDNYHKLQHIDIIPDYNDYHNFNDDDNTIIKIINYWQRKGSFADVFIPNDLYYIINQFYSLYNKDIVHIIFYFYLYDPTQYKIDHKIIDINENRRCDEEYLKPQLLSTINVKRETRYDVKEQFFPICRNGKFKLVSTVNNEMVSINLETGYIQLLTTNMNKFDKYHQCLCKYTYSDIWDEECYLYYYDIIDICNPLKQYIFLSRFAKSAGDLEVFIFDKLEMEMIPIYLQLNASQFLPSGNKLFYDGTFLYWIGDKNYYLYYHRQNKSMISKIKVQVNKNRIKCI